jgi:AcrR family transcriptional regulator
MNEKQQFHPLVAKWLLENQYTYAYEVKMPEYGRADFLATHKDGHQLIVECKADTSAKAGKSIMQLLDYRTQLPQSLAGYAIPSKFVTDRIVGLCQRYGVKLILIDIAQPIPVEIQLGHMRAKPNRRNVRHEMKAKILDIARRQMAEHGTAGLGLRAIAREMDVTAPAIYRYFPSLDDLITALILEDYHAIAEAMETADASLPQDDYAGRMLAVMLRYRSWALEHPIDFQLIYGNPIPGYEAPGDQTIPAARRGFDVTIGIIGGAYAAGQITPPEAYHNLPTSVTAQLEMVQAAENYTLPPIVLYLAVVGWTRVHGIIMLELFNSLQPLTGDGDHFYRFEVQQIMKQLGFQF